MEKQKINARIVADSISPQGNRITTFVLTYPRIIHAEVMTHRLFSRNAASSRAIPFKTMVKSIMDDPFIPIAWQKDHKGMQGTEYFNPKLIPGDGLPSLWLKGRNEAVEIAQRLHSSGHGVTKQLCNRLLEPFLWYTNLVTVTELENFYELRCPKYKVTGIGGGPARSRKDWLKRMKFSSALHPSQYPKTEEDWWKLSESGAEIHIQALAESMWDARNESTPKKLKAGDWHIPFGDTFSIEKLNELQFKNFGNVLNYYDHYKIKIATARCARLSYMTFDGDIDYQKDIELHDMLLQSKHFSPFEHCAKVMTNKEYHDFIKGRTDIETSNGFTITTEDQRGWCNNFKGFIQCRYLIENGIITN